MSEEDAIKSSSERRAEADVEKRYAYLLRQIRYHLLRLTNDPDAVDELTDEVLRRASTKLTSPGAAVSPSVWIYAVTRNVAYQHLRSKSAQRGESETTRLAEGAVSADPAVNSVRDGTEEAVDPRDEAKIIEEIDVNIRVAKELRAAAHLDDEEVRALREETRRLITEMLREVRAA